jgi:hypothetical protein
MTGAGWATCPVARFSISTVSVGFLLLVFTLVLVPLDRRATHNSRVLLLPEEISKTLCYSRFICRSSLTAMSAMLYVTYAHTRIFVIQRWQCVSCLP